MDNFPVGMGLKVCEGSREGFARIAATIDMESFVKMSLFFTHSHFDDH